MSIRGKEAKSDIHRKWSDICQSTAYNPETIKLLIFYLPLSTLELNLSRFKYLRNTCES